MANFFSAVIVHAYFSDRIMKEDHEAVEDRVRTEKALFGRMDVERSGEIPISSLGSIAELLRVDEGSWTEAEASEAVLHFDGDGSGTLVSYSSQAICRCTWGPDLVLRDCL